MFFFFFGEHHLLFRLKTVVFRIPTSASSELQDSKAHEKNRELWVTWKILGSGEGMFSFCAKTMQDDAYGQRMFGKGGG